MLRNYLKIAWRNLIRHKGYSAINIGGLAVGMAICILVGLYVMYELSYDNFHQNADRIFRLTTLLTTDGKEEHVAWTPNFVGQQLQADYPEVEQIIRLQAHQGKMAFNLPAKSSVHAPRKTTQAVNVDQVYTVYDPAFFQVFTYPMLEGNPKTALSRPGSVILTESVAQNLFGLHWQQGKSVLGQVLQSGGNSYQITGVLRTIPANTDLPFQVLLSQDEKTVEKQTWCIIYALFKQAANGASFSPKLAEITKKIQPDFAKRGGHIAFSLENLRDIHLGAFKTFDTPKANPSYLLIISLAAGFLLLIASINYINLSLVQSFGRSQEVGIRKVTGATHVQVLVQFIGESMILSGLALTLSLFLVSLLLPAFNKITDTNFSFVSLINWRIGSLLLVIFGIVGILAGSYPAFYLTSLNPVKALKGKRWLSVKSTRNVAGRGLVVIQFTISIAIVIGTFIIYMQLHFWRNKSLGFRSEQVLVINIPEEAAASGVATTLKTKLSGLAVVRGVALCGANSLPSQETNLSAFNIEKAGKMLPLPQRTIDIDENYLNILGIPLVAGRNFTTRKDTASQLKNSVHEVIVNEALATKMGWQGGPNEAVGKQLSQGSVGEETWRGRVVGVIRNFHFQSLQKAIEPMVLQSTATELPEKVIVRLTAGNFPEQISLIEAQWKKTLPNSPFEFTFLDTAFNQQYRQEDRLMIIFTHCSLLTILISCLGLLGLAAFSAEQRTKEIGVRKVLGASVASIVALLSRDFLKLVLIAIVIASPIAYYAMHHWLQDFAYRIDISWWVFALAGLLAVGVALLTVSFQSVKVALMNPVNSLKTD